MPQSERLFTRSDEGYFAASPRYHIYVADVNPGNIGFVEKEELQ